MGLCDPAEREGFLAEVRASAEAARRFETKRLVVLTGNKVSTLSREQQHASIVEGLKRAHDIVAPHGITLILEVINTLAPVEPLNPKTNHLDYYLNRTPEAFSIVREVGSPFRQSAVRPLPRSDHGRKPDRDLAGQHCRHRSLPCRRCPGRHEPGTGEIHHGNVFRAIHETGYKDFVAMEYVPSKDAMKTLAEVRALAASSRPK